MEIFCLVPGSAKYTEPGIQNTLSTFQVSNSNRTILTSALIDSSIEFLCEDKEVEMSFVSRTIWRGIFILYVTEKRVFKIFPPSIPSVPTNISAAPIDLTGLLDLCDIHDRQ